MKIFSFHSQWIVNSIFIRRGLHKRYSSKWIWMVKETPSRSTTHSMQEQLILSDVLYEGENGFFTPNWSLLQTCKAMISLNTLSLWRELVYQWKANTSRIFKRVAWFPLWSNISKIHWSVGSEKYFIVGRTYLTY